VTKLLTCMTLREEVEQVVTKNPGIEVDYLEYALHQVPGRLRSQLRARIDATPGAGDILLGYGLCSYGTAGLGSTRHRLVIPRVHDCISLLMGDQQRYLKEFSRYPGTFYLSKGWIDQGADPLSTYRRYQKDYGEETASWLMEQQYRNYQRVVFILSGVPGLDEYLGYAREVAGFLKVPFLVQEGSLRLLEKLVQGPWDREFIVTEPGEIILQQAFFG